jgi:uncharacterized protein (DUF983 family)
LRRVAAAAHGGFDLYINEFHFTQMSELQRSWKQAMTRGFLCRCPSCGQGRLFRTYLKTVDTCAHCGEDLHHQRADDAPPYFTMMIVAHLVIPAMVIIERIWQPAIWLQLSFWLPATLILTLALLPTVKGAIVGLQWALRMHGFGFIDDEHAKP